MLKKLEVQNFKNFEHVVLDFGNVGEYNFNEEIIKKAYRKKAKSLHPDLNKGYDTTEDMQKLNEAKNNLEEDYQYWNKYLEGE